LAVPVTPEGKLVLGGSIFAVQGRILEFPATVEPNEDPAETIKRVEERNRLPAQVEKLGEFFLAPGYSDEIIYAFLAQDLERLDMPPSQDADEDIETVLLTPQELEQAILDGEPVDAKSISSFLLARPFLQNKQYLALLYRQNRTPRIRPNIPQSLTTFTLNIAP